MSDTCSTNANAIPPTEGAVAAHNAALADTCLTTIEGYLKTVKDELPKRSQQELGKLLHALIYPDCKFSRKSGEN